MKKLLLAILLSLSLVAPVSAGQPQSLTIPTGYPLGGEKQNPVEQQTDWPWVPGPIDCSGNVNCVVNPLPCAWDVDDHWQVVLTNRTLVGSVSGTVCFVSDADPVYRTVNGNTAWWSSNRARYGVKIIAPSNALIVTVTYAQQGRTFTLAPKLAGPGYCNGCVTYEFCGHVIYSPGDPALAEIPGSGGEGIRSDITLSVTNPNRQAVKGIILDEQSVGAGSSGASCILNVTYDQQFHEYPLEWTQS